MTTALPVDLLLPSTSRTMRIRLASLVRVFTRLLWSTPIASAYWLLYTLFVGTIIPFNLWAGRLALNAIESRVNGDLDANPWPYVFATIGAFASARLLAPLNEWSEADVMEHGVPAVRAEIYRQVTEIDLASLEHQAFYDNVHRIAEESGSQFPDLLKNMRICVSCIIPIFATSYLLISVDWKLLLVLLLPILPLALQALKSGSEVWNILTNQTRDRRIAAYIAGQFSDRQAAKEIRLFGLKDVLIDRWAHHFQSTRDELRWRRTKSFLKLQLSFSATDIPVYAALIWLMTGSQDYDAGTIALAMGAFMSIGNQMFNAMDSIRLLGTNAGFADDIERLLSLPTPFRSDELHALDRLPQSDIRAERLSFTYPGTQHPVIDGLDLTIPVGQTIAIVGENGAGKTTLLKLLLGLYQPTSGAVLLGSRNLQTIPPAERRERFSAVFQQFTRYPLTFRENIVLDADLNPDELDRVIADAGVERAIQDTPRQLETILAPDLGGVDLSGGQWQRTAIARAGYRKADVLALDEPTAALDPLAEVDIFRRFAQLAENRTTLLVSHRLGICRLADRIIVLEHGRITEDGTHDELVTAGGHYAELWEMQSRWYH